ncbi:DUF6455 family protein [Mesorhizobium qingshengii]|uniref:DUF6455 family protein n=2 Tax=Mesorhizobium qingshengii TaxID=1165689 RepID=A0ABT4R3D2_9HYPH|nr:DUF6455 family protein [Mesorhizobium qingshengii]MCZ8548330.1 DUF6455 family protein [Mesorhizobium qingshengii]
MRSGQRNWSQSERVWRQFEFMDLVMEQIEVNPLVAARKCGGTAMAGARNVCLGCAFQHECRDWLERGGDLAGLAEFCSNAGFFMECKRSGQSA